MRRQEQVGSKLAVFVFHAAIAVVMTSGCSAPATNATPASPLTKSVETIPTTWHARLEVSGGFAGIHRNINLSDDGVFVVEDQKPSSGGRRVLHANELQEFRRLIAALPAQLDSSVDNQCNDCFDYVLTVTRDTFVQDMRANSLSKGMLKSGELIDRMSTIAETLTSAGRD
jgi:hypothetical protein